MPLGVYPTEFNAKAIYDAVREQLRKDGPFPMYDQETGALQGHILSVELDGLKVMAIIKPETHMLPIFEQGSMRDVSVRNHRRNHG